MARFTVTFSLRRRNGPLSGQTEMTDTKVSPSSRCRLLIEVLTFQQSVFESKGLCDMASTKVPIP
jgi:hypothetical protein